MVLIVQSKIPLKQGVVLVDLVVLVVLVKDLVNQSKMVSKELLVKEKIARLLEAMVEMVEKVEMVEVLGNQAKMVVVLIFIVVEMLVGQYMELDIL